MLLKKLTIYLSWPKQLKVDHFWGRYLEMKVIMRYYREFIADRAPQQVIVGGSKTTCSQYGSGIFAGSENKEIDCQTSAPKYKSIGGQIGHLPFGGFPGVNKG